MKNTNSTVEGEVSDTSNSLTVICEEMQANGASPREIAEAPDKPIKELSKTGLSNQEHNHVK